MSFGEAAARLSSAATLLLGWRPHEFWNATPAELASAMSVADAVDAPDVTVIEALRRRFPDDKKQVDPGSSPG
jgi:Phage tail assembly chaperone protein, TAC